MTRTLFNVLFQVAARGGMKEKRSWVYLLASGRHGTLYVGVTSDLSHRISQHRSKAFGGFTARYGVTRLVWFEEYGSIADAICREKKLKKWHRDWKIALIEGLNPDWCDMGDVILR